MWTRAVGSENQRGVGAPNRLPLLMLVSLGLLTLLAACTSPAAPASTSPASFAGTPTGAAPHNQGDVTFAQMMIISHVGATDMAGLAEQTSTNEQVRALAERINAAKGPEINEMRGWLATWGEPLPETADMSGMAHDGTRLGGFEQQPEMNALLKLDGAAFDRKFLSLMLAHHRGTLAVAAKQVGEGQSTEGIELARNIMATQQSEIAEMESLLGSIK